MPLWVDPSGREPRPAVLSAVGVVVVVVMVISGIVLTTWSRGGFAEKFTITVVSTQIGDGLAEGADVKYRGYTIGKVSSLTVGSDGSQRVQLSIDDGQTAGLTTDVVPVYRATNMFAATGVELVPAERRGSALRSGAILTVRSASTALGTMTSVLSRLGKLTTPLSDAETLRSLDSVLTDADPYIKLVRNLLPLLSGLATDQRISIGQALRDTQKVLDVIRPAVAPIFSVIDQSLNASSYLDQPTGLNRTTTGIDGLINGLVKPLGRIIGGRNAEPLKSLIGVALDFGVPIVVSVGTVPNAYHRLNTLIRSTGDAFALQPDGKVRLLIEVLLTKAPQIAAPLLYKEVRGGER
ncbi:MlaD family protein [Gordonia sp. CPCC 205333]|uniref:MlaD family protein n=1 Tax=Gordonia sp. CPCC 205333 TaxID=3140790 RepID=UPI003AF3A388